MKPFIVDNQLPAALVRWLKSKGCRAEHVLDLNLAQALDQAIWDRAARDNSVIISKDEDFAQLALLRTEAVSVIWLRIGNCRTTDLLATMERAWPDLLQQIETGSRVIELF